MNYSRSCNLTGACKLNSKKYQAWTLKSVDSWTTFVIYLTLKKNKEQVTRTPQIKYEGHWLGLQLLDIASVARTPPPLQNKQKNPTNCCLQFVISYRLSIMRHGLTTTRIRDLILLDRRIKIWSIFTQFKIRLSMMECIKF